MNDAKLFSINLVLKFDSSKVLFWRTDIKKDLLVLIPSISNSFKYFTMLLILSVLLEPLEIIFAIIGS